MPIDSEHILKSITVAFIMQFGVLLMYIVFLIKKFLEMVTVTLCCVILLIYYGWHWALMSGIAYGIFLLL